MMSQADLYEIIDDLLVLINGKLTLDSECPSLDLDMILEANDGIIRSRFSESDILFALKHIADP